MSKLIHLSPSATPYAFALPSHFEVGPTASEPTRGKMDLRQVTVRRLPLPFYEDFKTASSDAFEGKTFVRFPRKAAETYDVHGPVARLRSAQLPFPTMWLPHHCIVDDNNLAKVREVRRARQRGASAALAGKGARSVHAR